MLAASAAEPAPLPHTPGGTRADRKITLTEVSEYCENNFNTWIFLTFIVDRDAHTITGFFDGHQIGDPVDFSQNKHGVRSK